MKWCKLVRWKYKKKTNLKLNWTKKKLHHMWHNLQRYIPITSNSIICDWLCLCRHILSFRLNLHPTDFNAKSFYLLNHKKKKKKKTSLFWFQNNNNKSQYDINCWFHCLRAECAHAITHTDNNTIFIAKASINGNLKLLLLPARVFRKHINNNNQSNNDEQ